MAPVLEQFVPIPQGVEVQQAFEQQAFIVHPMGTGQFGAAMLWPCLGTQMLPAWGPEQVLMGPAVPLPLQLPCEQGTLEKLPDNSGSPRLQCQKAAGTGCSATRRRRERRLRKKLSLAAASATSAPAAKPVNAEGGLAAGSDSDDDDNDEPKSPSQGNNEGEDQKGHARRPIMLDMDQLPETVELVGNADLSNVVIDQLDAADSALRAGILKWLLPATFELAMSAHGCRVVQKALEVAERDDRAALVLPLRGKVVCMLESPHGNHVLQKCIEVLPAGAVQFMLDELATYPGGWAAVAQHRFGCRVEERILEHFPAEITSPLVTAVVLNAHKLCRHPFGNYVVQHVLEYSSKEQRAQLVSVLIGHDIVFLAQDHVASNVVVRAIEQCGPEGQRAIAQAILSAPPALLTIACSRYGSHTARRLLDVLQPPIRNEAVHQLSVGLGRLRSSRYGKGIADRLA